VSKIFIFFNWILSFFFPSKAREKRENKFGVLNDQCKTQFTLYVFFVFLNLRSRFNFPLMKNEEWEGEQNWKKQFKIWEKNERKRQFRKLKN